MSPRSGTQSPNSKAENATQHIESVPDSSRRRGHKIGAASRTPRACDRCRLKKSKCTGLSPCATCVLHDRICIYSARRQREVKNWYPNLQDTIDQAIHRLYYACKERGTFPGQLPPEQDGQVTTESILEGLGLWTSPPPYSSNSSIEGNSDSNKTQNEEVTSAADSTVELTVERYQDSIRHGVVSVKPAQQPQPSKTAAEHASQPSSRTLMTMCEQFNDCVRSPVLRASPDSHISGTGVMLSEQPIYFSPFSSLPDTTICPFSLGLHEPIFDSDLDEMIFSYSFPLTNVK